MTIRIYMDNFRNHAQNHFEIMRGVNMIHGPNGAGKTSILEAISLLTPGSGLRKVKFAEMARNGTEFWNLSMQVDGNVVDIGYRNKSKQMLWNGAKISTHEVVDEIGMSWITPQIMFHFWKDPKARRHFIDRVTSSNVSSYAYNFMYYEKLRAQRNKLLQMQSQDRNAFEAMENLMVKHGSELVKARADMVAKLNEASGCRIVMKDSADLISEARWLEKLAKTRHAETTTVGPHKTDVQVYKDDKEGANASTGEQNTMLIALLLASFDILEQNIRILLLDDVFSHLDEMNCKNFLDLIRDRADNAYICITDTRDLGCAGHRIFVQSATDQVIAS